MLPQACSQGNAASPRERVRSHQERPSVAAARSEGLTWSGFKAPSTDRRCLLSPSPQSLECTLAPVLQRPSLRGRDGTCVQRRGQAPGRCGHRGNWWHSRSGDAGPGRFAPRGAHVGSRGLGLGRGPGTRCWDAPVSRRRGQERQLRVGLRAGGFTTSPSSGVLVLSLKSKPQSFCTLQAFW